MRWISTQDLYYLAVVAIVVAAGAVPSERLRERIARRLGWLAYRTSRKKRRVVEANVAKAFGDRPDAPRIVQSSFEDLWREMLCWASPPPRRAPRVTGLEHLQRALEEGCGAILWESNGFGRRLVAKQFLHAIGVDVHQIHGRNNLGNFLVDDRSRTWVREALVKRFFDRQEQQFVAELVYLPASESLAFTRHLHRQLRQNRILCVAGDGHHGRRFVPLEFLGRMVPFASGMVSLSQLSGAPLLPVFCTPDGDGEPRLTIESPIRVDPSAGRGEALRRALVQYAAQLEARIRHQPGSYRNWHLLGDDLCEEKELVA